MRFDSIAFSYYLYLHILLLVSYFLIASFWPKKVIMIATSIPTKPMLENIRLYWLLILKIFNRLVINNKKIPIIFIIVSVLFKQNHVWQEGHCFSIKILFLLIFFISLAAKLLLQFGHVSFILIL